MPDKYDQLARRFGGQSVGPDSYDQMAEQARSGDPMRALAKAETIAPPPPLIYRLLDMLPTLGGMTGGLIGGAGGTAFGMGFGGVPGAMGGAGFGGATGEAARQLGGQILGRPSAPDAPLEAAKAIGQEGAVQGALEGAGGLVARGAVRAGRSLLENAVRPTQTLLKEFPDVLSVIERERLPVGAGIIGESGSQQARGRLGAASRAVRQLLERATQDGTTFTADEVARPVLDLVDDIAKQPLAEAEQQKLAGLIDQFLREHPGPLTPTAVKDLKDRAWALSRTVLKAEQRGAVPTADQALGGRFNRAIGTGAKEALETIPGVREGEKLAQELIGAKRALTQAEQRRLSLMAEGVSGLAGAVAGALSPGGGADDRTRNAALAWLAARGLASPRSMSRMGLALTSRQAKELVRQFPRLAAYVLLQPGEPDADPAQTGR